MIFKNNLLGVRWTFLCFKWVVWQGTDDGRSVAILPTPKSRENRANMVKW